MGDEPHDACADLPHNSLCSCQSLTAASPVGAAVCPLAKSESVDLGTSIRSAICAKVIDIGAARRSAMRDCHVVAMPPSIRDTVSETQRHPVTEFRQLNRVKSPTDYPGPTTHLGERLKYWREFRKLSRIELGKLADVAPTTIGTIEVQQQHSSTKIVQLATALEINPEYLATGEGNPYQKVQQVPPRKDWPEEFPPLASIVGTLDSNERTLLGLRMKDIVEEIKSKRTKRRKDPR